MFSYLNVLVNITLILKHYVADEQAEEGRDQVQAYRGEGREAVEGDDEVMRRRWGGGEGLWCVYRTGQWFRPCPWAGLARTLRCHPGHVHWPARTQVLLEPRLGLVTSYLCQRELVEMCEWMSLHELNTECRFIIYPNTGLCSLWVCTNLGYWPGPVINIPSLAPTPLVNHLASQNKTWKFRSFIRQEFLLHRLEGAPSHIWDRGYF